ncbi:MAG: DUF2007 domain-containing protein [Alphaproteobacteria bacterium]|nr:DUF2007 domain-containing protein [Alphaproteobacteria bacterium]MDE2110701.1 DUF2007 domain-containing protein [Alphaproteobacteria bacterium]MDE2494506.1 DUF2007 domain-containing protein [Alphaproteobacteria bacterium]
MRAVLKTNNPVQLSFAEVLLMDAGIRAVVFDGEMSVMDGSLGVLPRRLMVADEDFDRAMAVLRDGMEENLPEDGVV